MAKKYLLRMAKNAIHLTFFALIGAFMVFLACYLYVAPQLPAVETLREYKLQTPMSVYSSDGELIANFGEKRRIPLNFDEIPDTLNQALIATEDKRFYEHGGVDGLGLLRAVYELVSTGQIGGGGSTITMQLARNFFLSFTQTFTRKTKEIFLSWKIEQSLTKQEILTLYWNKIDFSYRANGIGAAAQVYYGKTVDQLTLPQLAILAGIPKGPTTHNPLANPEKAFNRRNHVLRRMLVENYIDEATYQEAVATPLSATYHGSRITVSAPYLAEMVRSDMVKRFGREEAYTAGYKVYTTIDSKLQEAGRQSLRKALVAYDRRHGYRGAEQNFPEVADFALELNSLLNTIDAQNFATATQEITTENVNAKESETTTDNEVSATEVADRDTVSNEAINDADLKSRAILTALEQLDLDTLESILRDFSVLGELQPALVLSVEEQAMTVLLKKYDRLTTLQERIIRVEWDGLEWARPFINENRRGPKPRTASAIAQPGDLIRIYQDKEKIWQLGQLPAVKAAFVALNPDDGAVKTLVGGFDFNLNKFNNVTQARRQLGSNIKPFIYSAALEKGYTAATVVNDAPFTKVDPTSENIWRPKNDSGNYKGPTRLRNALSRSTNMVSIRLVNDITPDYTVDYLSQIGFDRRGLPKVASIALGSPSFSPLDLVTHYASFANGGYQVSSYFIERIEDANGNIIFSNQPTQVCEECLDILAKQAEPENNITDLKDDVAEISAEDLLLAEIAMEQGATNTQITNELAATDVAVTSEDNVDDDTSIYDRVLQFEPALPIDESLIAPRVIAEDNVYILDSMMRDVITRGTAARTLRQTNSPLLKRNDLGGKTGTTNDAKDAWFSGYNGDYVATAWVGNQKYTDPGLGNNEYGGKAALPIWQGFMEAALQGKPDHSVPQPPGLVTAKIDPKTGLLAPAGMRGAIFEVFRQRFIPKQYAESDVTNPFEVKSKEEEDLF